MWLQVIDSGPIAKWVARALVCAYYVNQVGEELSMWDSVGCGLILVAAGPHEALSAGS